MSQIICIKYQHLVNILADHLNNKLLGKKMMPGKADLKCKHVVARLQQITLMSSSIIWLKQNYSLHTLHVKGILDCFSHGCSCPKLQFAALFLSNPSATHSFLWRHNFLSVLQHYGYGNARTETETENYVQMICL